MPHPSEGWESMQAQLHTAAEFATSLPGLTYAAASQSCRENGYRVQRITRHVEAVTADLRSDRIRCWVDDDDVVTEARAG